MSESEQNTTEEYINSKKHAVDLTYLNTITTIITFTSLSILYVNIVVKVGIVFDSTWLVGEHLAETKIVRYFMFFIFMSPMVVSVAYFWKLAKYLFFEWIFKIRSTFNGKSYSWQLALYYTAEFIGVIIFTATISFVVADQSGEYLDKVTKWQ